MKMQMVDFVAMDDVEKVFLMTQRRSVPKVWTEGLKSRTKQSMKDECDINNVLKKYQKTGFITHVKQSAPVYADVSSGIDYRESMETVLDAQKMFMALPAKARRKFGNDPAEFLEYVQNPANVKEMIELGLAFEVKPPADVPPVADKPPVEPA